MPDRLQRPSPKFTVWVVAAHIIATPVITWLAIVYSALGAPWREVHALWHAQAILLGTWYGMSTTSLARRQWLSLGGLLWLSAMPTAREVSVRGFPVPGFSWLTYLVVFGFQSFYLVLGFTAAAVGLVFSKTVWPRWRVVAIDRDSDREKVPQFSIKQLMIAVTACTPVLLLTRLAHDHLNLAAVHILPAALLSGLLGSPLAAAIAVLSIWAALGRRFVIARLAIAAVALPVVVFLIWYAEQYAASRIIGHIIFEESQLLVVLATLLLFRWNGYRIERTE